MIIMYILLHQNGFDNQKNNIFILPRSLILPKEFFVRENHILLMNCRSSTFNATLEEDEGDI